MNDVAAGAVDRRPPCPSRLTATVASQRRQREHEGAIAIRELTALASRQLACDRKPKARATASVEAHKPFEDPLLETCRQARTVVADNDVEVLVVVSLDNDVDHPESMTTGVVQEVRESVSSGLNVDRHNRTVLGGDREAKIKRTQMPRTVEFGDHDMAKIDNLPAQGLALIETGDSKQRTNQASCAGSLVGQVREQLLLSRRRLDAQQCVRRRPKTGDRRA